MKRLLTMTSVMVLSLTSAAFAMDEAERARQMDAYKAQMGAMPTTTAPVEQAQEAVAVTPVATQAPQSVVTTTASGGTTTLEKTNTTKYTVTTRKVGLVGKRPYPAQTSEMEGGVTKEVFVNGVESSKEVIVPDTAAEKLKNESAVGDYYSARPEAKIYETEMSTVRVHNAGSFNH